MTYIRLDDTLPLNNKTAEMTDAEFRSWIYLLCASSQQRSDGRISDGVLRQVVPQKRVRDNLAAKGHIHKNGSGWVIHDYLEHQRSRSQIEAARAAAIKAATTRHDHA